VTTKKNIQGQIFCFVLFGKVMDERKLEAMLNNVLFGKYEVWVRLACFGRDSKVAIQNSVGKDKEEEMKVGRGEGQNCG
jgi:hypothetical protein